MKLHLVGVYHVGHLAEEAADKVTLKGKASSLAQLPLSLVHCGLLRTRADLTRVKLERLGRLAAENDKLVVT